MATVTISQGTLRGGKSVTENGFEYYEFLGVPYAKPPVGNLRFQSPQSPVPWTNVRDATKYDLSKIACQLQFMNICGEIAGSEDCLYLNVYTPQLRDQQTSPLPVVVYIHSGGFLFGSGIFKDATGPDYLVESGTVVVAINYRLGVLGFLSLGIPEVAGNMGLKDQVKALEWVRDNIREFGGDRNNITIMGSSAGSASIDYLILSPTAKGLFHKAILQSGSALNHWAVNFETTELTRNFIKRLDYKGSLEDAKAVYEFLMTIPAEVLVRNAEKVQMKHSSRRIFCGFVPTVERDFGNNDAFLTKSPYTLFKQGNFNLVPMIKGFCNKEGSLTSVMKADAMDELAEDKDFAGAWPYDIGYKEKVQINQNFINSYLGKVNDEQDLTDALEDFFSDFDFVSGIWLSGRFVSRKAPVFMYQFSYDGTINLFKKMIDIDKKGALHGDDSSYVIKNNAEIYSKPNALDVLVRQRLVKMFTDFAKTGYPVPEKCNLIPINWPLFKASSPVYLNIDEELTTLENYEPVKMALFEELYEKYFG